MFQSIFLSFNTQVQYHDVRVTVQLNAWANCVNYMGSVAPTAQPMQNCQLMIDYVYLDSEERKRFAQASHEYLIEQLQFTGSESITATSNKYRLNFNHPSKYLVWVPHLNNFINPQQWAVHALAQGSWQNAYDQMAKIVALGESGAASSTNANQQCSVSVNVLSAEDPVAQGLFNLNYNGGGLGGGCLLDGMWSKVNVLVKAYSGNKAAVQPAGLPAGQSLWNVVVGQGSPSTDPNINNPNTALSNAWQDAFDNCVVTQNNLKASDISFTVNSLKGISQQSQGVAVPVLDENTYKNITVLDQFNYGNFIDGTDNPCMQAKIQLNGHDRFQALDGYYFNYVQPYQHFSHTPADGVNVYSFALKAEDHQPTGTCNFSRIDNATLQVDLGITNTLANMSAIFPSNTPQNTVYTNYFLGANSSLLNIYTVNYNVLRVMSEKILWLALMICQSIIINKSYAQKSSTLIQKTHKNKEKSLVEC